MRPKNNAQSNGADTVAAATPAKQSPNSVTATPAATRTPTPVGTIRPARRIREIDAESQPRPQPPQHSPQAAAALQDLGRGWYSIPVPNGQKSPTDRAWTDLRLSAAEIPDAFPVGVPMNRGLLLGEPSGGLVDIDVDDTVAVRLAPSILPTTDRVYGRAGKLRSHYQFVCSPVPKTKRLQDVGGEVLVEVRSTGCQSIVPPSTHPSGEQYRYHEQGEAARIDASELEARVYRLAAATLLARSWPTEGSRHDFALAVAGTLLRAGMTTEDAEELIQQVAEAADDDEVDDRVRAVGSTAEALEADSPATGRPTLEEYVGTPRVKKLLAWLRRGWHLAPTSLNHCVEVDDEEFERVAAELLAAAAVSKTTFVGPALKNTDMLAILAASSRHNPAAYEALIDDLRVAGVTGKRIDSLRKAVSAEARKLVAAARTAKASCYEVVDGEIYHNRVTANGVEKVRLLNFEARIIRQVEEDDGAEARRSFELECKLKDRTVTVMVPVSGFAPMNWPMEKIGPDAIVAAGFGARDQARAAIQELSGVVPIHRTRNHTGWHDHEGGPVYLHGGGAIGEQGSVAGISVRLDGPLKHYRLPHIGNELPGPEALSELFDFIGVAPARITVPLLATAFRAAINASDFTVFLVGPTGVGKTELAALVQQCFGAGMTARNLPGSWTSTPNALEFLQYRAKDTLLPIDDFTALGSRHDVDRAHAQADRVLRGQGNHQARQRLAADTSPRPDRPPRCTLLVTGEEAPRAHSARSRCLIMDVAPGDVAWDRLTSCQRAAAGGDYALVMAYWIRWLARLGEALRSCWRPLVEDALDSLPLETRHKRTAMVAAELVATWGLFCDFIAEAKQADPSMTVVVDGLRESGCSAILEAVAAQDIEQTNADPVDRFTDLLRSALGSGRAHLASVSGSLPPHPERSGWRSDGTGVDVRWQPMGARIGWVDGDQVLLDPAATYAAVQQLAEAAGGGLGISSHSTLASRLDQRGLLLVKDAGRKRRTARRSIGGERSDLWVLAAKSIWPS